VVVACARGVRSEVTCCVEVEARKGEARFRWKSGKIGLNGT